jgi:periplasmic copper chaperone A
MSRKRISVLALTLTAVAIAAPAAEAHVTLNPRTATANSFARLDVRVPTERDDAGTRSVVVNFPDGFYSVSVKRVWGWTATIKMERLATPIPSEDGDITEQVAKVTWRANGKANHIAPHFFEEFGLSMRIPNTPGVALAFPSTQTYSSKEIVRWNGASGSDTPAPIVNVVAAS